MMRRVARVALLFVGFSLSGCVSASNVPTPSQFSLIPLSAIVLSPTSLTFAGPGTPAQTFTAAEAGYSGPFALTGTCSAGGSPVVSFSPATGHGPLLGVTVVPLALGACTIVVDDGLRSAAEDVNVGTGFTVAPNSVAFGSPTDTPQSAVFSQPGYTGTFTLTDTCHRANPATATYAPTSGNGPTLTIVVSPGAIGECVITATDQASRSVSITVSVAATSIRVR
jgi:hypothetical protein